MNNTYGMYGMASNDSEIMTLPQLARYLSMAERTIYLWAQQGRIPAFKLGTSWRFRKSEIDAWMATQRTGPVVSVGREPLVVPVEPPKSGWRAKQDAAAAERALVEECVAFIREAMRAGDREVWPLEQFLDQFGRRYVDTAIDQMKKSREITVTQQRGLEGIEVPVIKRRR
jgi:excisionase family DNA binding protein